MYRCIVGEIKWYKNDVVYAILLFCLHIFEVENIKHYAVFCDKGPVL